MSLRTQVRAVLLALALLLPHAGRAASDTETTKSSVFASGETLAVPDFTGSGGAMLAGVAGNDLAHTNLFGQVRYADKNNPATTIDKLPDFAAWTAAGVRYLLVGAASDLPGDRVLVKVRLWDIARQSQILGRQFISLREAERGIGHLISNAIVERATSKAGDFNTYIVFISSSGKTSRLAFMNQDGGQQTFLTNGKYPASDPFYFPSGDMVAYIAEVNNQQQLLLFSLSRGLQKTVGKIPGPVKMPAVSPDNKTIALICEVNGHADICLIDIATEQLIRTISHTATDAFPNFSPDGKSLVFQSDLEGTQGIFVMDTDGSHLHRLAQSGGKLGSPAWSGDGLHIAVTRYTDEGSHIAIVDADGNNLRDISSGAQDIRPSWAPSSQALLFTRADAGKNQLWVADIAGHGEYQIPTPDGASAGSWWGRQRPRSGN